jgi:hypothetical protein
MPKLIDITGLRFGRLVVIRRSDNNAEGKPCWLCHCDCGQLFTLSGANLKSGNTVSCGCYRRSIRYRHGHTSSKGKNHPLYHVWQSMKSRCTNPNAQEYKNYGGRGISVCERWSNSFPDFLTDIGERPGPVRWATPLEQTRNRHRA